MSRLIKSAMYRPGDHSHDHQDPDTAKAMLIDAGIRATRLRAKAERMAEALRDVISDTVDAREYPDGPCLNKHVRDEAKAALADWERLVSLSLQTVSESKKI